MCIGFIQQFRLRSMPLLHKPHRKAQGCVSIERGGVNSELT
jgi:hypothetical protein